MYWRSLLVIFVFVGACTKSQAPANSQSEPATLSAAAAQGRATYNAQCIACHNVDPKKPGAIGPEIWGSAKELIEARVMRAEYPSGYKPKRETKAMQPLPHLKDQIDALHAYLNQ